jgi:hypothetical protein
MAVKIDEIDRTELQQKLRPKIEKRYGSKTKPAWVNLITIKAWPSGEPFSRDIPPIWQEEIREVTAGSTATMPQLTMKIPTMIDSMAGAMESAAKEMALNGTLRFIFELFVPGSDKAVATDHDSLYSEGDVPGDGSDGMGGRFAGTEKQDKAQEHRHREQMFRMNRDGIKTTMEFMSEQLDGARQRIKDQDALIVGMHKATQEAQSQALQREIMIKSAAVKEDMLMKAFSAFMAHLPIIAQYFTGGGNATFNMGSDPRLSALKAVYSGLSLEVKQDLEMKVIDLMSKIDSASQNVMMQVFQDLKKTENVERAQEAAKRGGSLPSGYGGGARGALTDGGLG